jgi:hypothetical protein
MPLSGLRPSNLQTTLILWLSGILIMIVWRHFYFTDTVVLYLTPNGGMQTWSSHLQLMKLRVGVATFGKHVDRLAQQEQLILIC